MDTNGILYACAAAVVLVAAGIPARALGLRLKLPPAVSLMTMGVVIGNSGLDVLPAEYRDASSYLSKAAFVVLLLRAGLGIPPAVLGKIALPAITIGIIPVAVELGVVVAGSRWLFFSDLHLALLAGFLIAAVSPAVILPTMLEQKHQRRGRARRVPDQIIVQTVINALIAQTGILIMLDVLDPLSHRALSDHLLMFPIGLLGGALVGLVAGSALRLEAVLGRPARQVHPGRIWPAVVAAVAACLLVYFGSDALGIESVIATLAVGITLRGRLEWCARDLQFALRRVWNVAEIFLFVNLGANLDLGRLSDAGLVASVLALIVAALLCRVAVTRFLVSWTGLTPGEKTYVTTAQLPKATIQAVFGAVIYLRLSSEGSAYAADAQILLIMAAVAIVATAPIGAVLLDRWGGNMLPASAKTQHCRNFRRWKPGE